MHTNKNYRPEQIRKDVVIKDKYKRNVIKLANSKGLEHTNYSGKIILIKIIYIFACNFQEESWSTLHSLAKNKSPSDQQRKSKVEIQCLRSLWPYF